MKLNLLPLLAGLFLTNLSFTSTTVWAQNSADDFSSVFADDSTAETASDGNKKPDAGNDSAVAAWEERQTWQESNDDTIDILSYDEFNHPKKTRFWYPSWQAMDSIVAYVKLISKYEDEKGDRSPEAKRERREFLKKMEFCRDHRIYFLYNVADNYNALFGTKLKNGKTILFGDAGTYQSLRELAEMVATRHLLVIQDYLVMNCWVMHQNHYDGEYNPILSAKQCEKIVTKTERDKKKNRG